jgi:hypothetical protein
VRRWRWSTHRSSPVDTLAGFQHDLKEASREISQNLAKEMTQKQENYEVRARAVVAVDTSLQRSSICIDKMCFSQLLVQQY